MKKNLSITFLLLSIVCLFVSSAETKRSHSPLVAVADLSVTKVDTPDPVNTGANLTYTITVTNGGPDAAANASLNDTLPPGTTFFSLSAPGGWSCNTPAQGDSGIVSCTNPSFAVGSAVFTLVVTVAPSVAAGSTISNTATATSSTTDGNPGNESGTASTTVLSPASISGNKVVSGGTTPGSTVNYLVILSNSSNSDQEDNPGNEFTDVLPAGLTLVSAAASSGTATATIATKTVTWNGIVPAQDSVTITIAATINNGTVDQTITNQGSISYDADGNGTNEASASTNAASFIVGASIGSADLGVVKVASADTLPADSDVTYTITVTNGGPDTAQNAALSDLLPGSMTFVSLSAPASWSCTTPAVGAGGTVSCTNSSLTVAAGAQVFTLVGHIPTGTPDGAFYTNMASVSGSTSDSNSENDNGTAGTIVGCLTNPIVTTSADSGPGSLRRAIQDACVGGTLTFDMTPGHITSPIVLTSAELLIDKNLTISGPGANTLTVQRSAAGGTPQFRIFNIQSATTVRISGLTVSGGNISSADGGGILNNSTLTLTNDIVSGNTAGNSSGGGGIFNNGGTLILTNSTVSGNTANSGSGGGIFILGGTINLTNSTMSSNAAHGGAGSAIPDPGQGGGIYNNGGTLTLTNSTLSGNTTTGGGGGAVGGGIFNASGATNIRNTIVANNTGANGPDLFGTINSQDYNLIGNTTDATFTGTTTHNIVNQSAHLGALASNGGPTLTMLPLPGSPAINAGDPANLPLDTFDADGDTDTAEQLPIDQRGFARVTGAKFDIGAVETNYALSVTAGSPQSATVNTAFATALKATLTESGNAQNSISVTFTAPLSGSSGTFPGSSATAVVSTNSSGDASAPTFTANAIGGSYNVIASIGTGLPTATFALTNNKINQTISFGALASKTFGDPDFTVSATASSGLTVVFGASGNCAVSVATVHITGAGSCTITASQPGDASFNPAIPVPQLFNIAKAATSSAVSSSPNPSNMGQSVTFTATVTSATGTPTGTVQFRDGGANLGSPQTLSSGIATFSSTSLSAGIHTITADYNGDANFLVSTGTLPGGQQVGSIIKFSSVGYNTTENSGFTTITVQRIGDLSQAVTVDYTTPDDSSAMTVLPCSTASGVASPRCDFETALGTLRFAAGDGAPKTFTVLINQDNFVEGPETLTLTLSNLTGGAAFSIPGATTSTATLTIADDLIEPATNPIDDTDAFVRQQYRDFLNREPDAAGLQFWTDNINKCTDPARRPAGLTAPQCIELFRINTSAAFYLSIEFQQSGYYVYRLNKAAFGDIAPPTVPVPVRFSQLIRDASEVNRGVIVGQGNWQAQLDQNKQALSLSFVQRPEFLSRYPGSTSASGFVDSLDSNAGSVLSAGERSALISELSPGPADAALRADVLTKVAENALLQQREFNRAFVLMEYFGYLRRNPDAAPEASLNFAGYNFWLDKLNSFNGDFNKADMVKAFINSAEYRQRFGP